MKAGLHRRSKVHKVYLRSQDDSEVFSLKYLERQQLQRQSYFSQERVVIMIYSSVVRCFHFILHSPFSFLFFSFFALFSPILNVNYSCLLFITLFLILISKRFVNGSFERHRESCFQYETLAAVLIRYNFQFVLTSKRPSSGYYTKIHHFVTGIEYRENERGEKHRAEQQQNICVRTAFIALGAAQFVIAIYEAALIIKGLQVKKEDDEDNVSIAALNSLDYDDNGSTTKASCSLCFSPHCENPCITPCGHIFCWDCAIRALREKEECPICRSRAIPSQVIRVYNL